MPPTVLSNGIIVLPPTRIGSPGTTPTGGGNVLNAINIIQSWSPSVPTIGNAVYIPAIVLEQGESVPSGTPVGTVVLVKGE